MIARGRIPGTEYSNASNEVSCPLNAPESANVLEEGMDLASVFDSVAKQMHADFTRIRGALQHTGLKGESVEELVRRFLREYLPRSLEIARGVLVDVTGKTSRELDVVVFDAAKTPTFFKSEAIRVIPVECAYGVIEVKTLLDSRELKSALENMKSVRRLTKSAFNYKKGPIKSEWYLYGRTWEFHPIQYYLFAFDSIKLDALTKELRDEYESKRMREWERIDCVCVLDKGVICNELKDGKIDALPSPGSQLKYHETPRSLLMFYMLVSNYFNQASIPDLDVVKYLRGAKF